MTKKELIEALAEFPDDMIVAVPAATCYLPVVIIEKVETYIFVKEEQEYFRQDVITLKP